MSSILPCTCFPCFSKPPPPSSLSCLSPHCPCGAKRLFTEPDRTLVCMAYGPFYHVFEWLNAVCVPKSPNKRGSPTPAPHRIPPPRCFLCCWWRWLLSVSCWWKKIGPLLFSGCLLLLLLHGFGVALKSFPFLVPLTMHVDPGWLLPSVSPCISLSTDTVSDFNLLFVYFLCSLFVSFNFASLLSNLSLFLSFLALSTPLCLPGTQRERWPWSCVSEA